MPAASEISIRGTISALPEGSRSLAPAALTNANAPVSVVQVELTSGANTITVPASAVGCLIIFDSTSTVTKTLKGVTGDTGVAVTKNKHCLLAFDSPPPTNFVITAGGSDSGKISTIHFF